MVGMHPSASNDARLAYAQGPSCSRAAGRGWHHPGLYSHMWGWCLASCHCWSDLRVVPWPVCRGGPLGLADAEDVNSPHEVVSLSQGTVDVHALLQGAQPQAAHVPASDRCAAWRVVSGWGGAADTGTCCHVLPVGDLEPSWGCDDTIPGG